MGRADIERDGIARVLRSVDWLRLITPFATAGQHPIADSLCTLISHQLDFSNSTHVEYGVIQDAIPSARIYRVAPESGGTIVSCVLGMQGAVSNVGVYDSNTLVVGTHVRFVRNKQKAEGTILCTVPMYTWDARTVSGDVITHGSNTTLAVETGYASAFDLGGAQGSAELNGGIENRGGRTPYDSLEIGEFNKSCETGLMMHMDPYMTFIRANEMSGLWMFYWDGMVRLQAENFQRIAAAEETEAYDDEGEHAYYRGVATYPWEHFGQLLGPDGSVIQAWSADIVQNQRPWVSANETADSLQPFHRFREYAGYLGQGQHKYMCAPDVQSVLAIAPALYTYTDTDYQSLGLHEQGITLSGHFGMRSALGLTIAKRPLIPIPKRNEIVTSEDGDDHDNYKASSYFGAGASHLVQPTPTANGAVNADDIKAQHMAASIMDLHAHLFNWEIPHPFHYHEYDYYFPEETEYYHVSNNQEVPYWDELDSTSQWDLDIAPYDSITLDHRTGGSAEVYRNTSYLSLLDEGGVCLGDGWGSEIKMVSGHIYITCPGDVFMEAGRNIVGWGGRDICMRANQSIDLTACWKDVRIKAEHNLHMLAANDEGPYGVLIECRSAGLGDLTGAGDGPAIYDYSSIGEGVEANGITLMTMKTELLGIARNIFLRTKPFIGKHDGLDDTSGSQPKEGDIVLDAKGEGDVITRSKFVKHWVECAVMHAFPDEPSIAQVNLFTEAGCILCNDVYTDGDLLSYGSHVAKGDYSTPEGHFYSVDGGLVAKLTAASTGGLSDAIEAGHTYEATLRTWSTNRWNIDMQTMWYSTGRPGNEDIMKSMWFSLRNQDDYKSDAFVLWENRWQQMRREGGGGGATAWVENSVETNKSSSYDDFTYPFPGRQRLTVDNAFYQQPHLLYNATTGMSVDRGPGGAYEAALTLSSQSPVVIDGNYRSISKS